jgi:hypothetical protein
MKGNNRDLWFLATMTVALPVIMILVWLAWIEITADIQAAHHQTLHLEHPNHN